MEDKRAKFLRIYAKIPDYLREDILVVVNHKSYTWDSACLEVKNNSPLGKKILNTLKEMDIL